MGSASSQDLVVRVYVKESHGLVPACSESSACLPEGYRQSWRMAVGPRWGLDTPTITPHLPKLSCPHHLACWIVTPWLFPVPYWAVSTIRLGLLLVFLHQHRPDLVLD